VEVKEKNVMKRLMRLEAVGVTLAIAMMSAHVIDQVFFAPAIFDGAMGLLALYAETVAIGAGIAVLRALDRARQSAPEVSRPSRAEGRVVHMPPARARFPFSSSVDTAVENCRNSAAS
jgi:hypothetical protein